MRLLTEAHKNKLTAAYESAKEALHPAGKALGTAASFVCDHIRPFGIAACTLAGGLIKGPVGAAFGASLGWLVFGTGDNSIVIGGASSFHLCFVERAIIGSILGILGNICAPQYINNANAESWYYPAILAIPAKAQQQALNEILYEGRTSTSVTLDGVNWATAWGKPFSTTKTASLICPSVDGQWKYVEGDPSEEPLRYKLVSNDGTPAQWKLQPGPITKQDLLACKR